MESNDMEKKDKLENDSLRQKAEEHLKNKQSEEAKNGTETPRLCQSIADHLQVIHELEVVQIALEMQKEELQSALEKAATAAALYDYSPTGYFTLESNGNICELNHNGAGLLGKERSELVNSNFLKFVTPDTLDLFKEFLRKAIHTNFKQICEVKLDVGRSAILYVHLEGFVSVIEQKCLITAIDITDHKNYEKKILLNESRLRRAELASKTGNWEFHIDSNVIYASEGAIKLYGVDRYILEYEDIKKITLQQYRPMLDLAMKNLIEENIPYNVEFKIKSQDSGEIKDIHSIATFDKEKRILFGSIQDITERKRLEDRIHESEQYYRTMVETSPDAIIIVNENGELKFASKKAYEIFFLPTDEPIGSSIFQWIAPEMLESTLARFKSVLSDEIKPESFEYKIIRNDGVIFWIEIRGSRLIDMEGNACGMLMICRDSTERKRAEDALQRAHDELKNLHDNLDEAVFSFDPVHNKMLQASQAHEAIFGYPPSEFYRNPQLWYEIIIPEDKAIADAGFPILLSGQDLKHELRITRPDGQLRWIACRMRPTLDKEGKLVQVDGIAYDVTQRRQSEEENRVSEEKFRMVFENVFDGIAIYNEDIDPYKRILIECNEQYASMAGRSREELLRLGSTQALQITHEASANANRLEALSLKKAFQGSYSWIRPDGKENVIEYIGVPIIWGGKSYSIGIDRDITEHRRSQVELIAAKEKAEESDRLKSAFLANMSHEIRTPLNSIIGFSELMSDPDFDRDQEHQFAQIINASGNNLLSIISDIMDISKIEAGQAEVKNRLFSVNQLISDLQIEYSFRAQEKGIALMLDPQNPTDVYIESDQTKLRQVLVNLVGNSIKFTEEGSIEIGLRIDGEFLEFRVKDSGIGISAEFQTQIFERFRQIESPYTRKYGGTGLGLAISKSLVELLGGTLWMESEQGKGSTFYFRLPVRP